MNLWLPRWLSLTLLTADLLWIFSTLAALCITCSSNSVSTLRTKQNAAFVLPQFPKSILIYQLALVNTLEVKRGYNMKGFSYVRRYKAPQKCGISRGVIQSRQVSLENETSSQMEHEKSWCNIEEMHQNILLILL